MEEVYVLTILKVTLASPHPVWAVDSIHYTYQSLNMRVQILAANDPEMSKCRFTKMPILDLARDYNGAYAN